MHFLPADFTLISAMEDGAPYSATYNAPPVPVVSFRANYSALQAAHCDVTHKLDFAARFHLKRSDGVRIGEAGI